MKPNQLIQKPTQIPPTLPQPTEPQPKSSKLPIILLTLVSLLSLAGLAYFYLQTQSLKQQLAMRPSPTLTPSPTPQPSPFPKTTTVPTSNGTKYMNQAYGIEFEYPQEVFVYHSEQPYAFFLSNKENGGSPMETGIDGIWLNLSFEKTTGTLRNQYQQIIDMPQNGAITEAAITKLKSINTNNIQGAVYFQGVPDNFGGEPAYTYSAVWIKNDITYKLSLSAFSKKNVDKYKPTFDQILSTFKFTDSQ